MSSNEEAEGPRSRLKHSWLAPVNVEEIKAQPKSRATALDTTQPTDDGSQSAHESTTHAGDLVSEETCEDDEDDWEDCSDDEPITETEPGNQMEWNISERVAESRQIMPSRAHPCIKALYNLQQTTTSLSTGIHQDKASESRAMVGDISTYASKEVWRLFESTRNSAIFHLEQYLRYKSPSIPSCPISKQLKTPKSRKRSPKKGHGHDRVGLTDSQWRFKIARDSLLHDLSNLHDLLRILESRGNMSSPGSPVLQSPTSPSSSSSASWTSWASSWSTTNNMTRVRLKIERLRQKVENQEVGDDDQRALEGKRFQMLWWTGHLYT